MPESKCKDALEKIKERLKDYEPQEAEGNLIIYGLAGKLEIVSSVGCASENKIVAMTAIPGFFDKLPEDPSIALKLLRRLLEIPADHYVIISDYRGSLMISMPASFIGEGVVDEVDTFLSLSALIAVWLSIQLEKASKGAEPEPFSIERVFSILESQGKSGES